MRSYYIAVFEEARKKEFVVSFVVSFVFFAAGTETPSLAPLSLMLAMSLLFLLLLLLLLPLVLLILNVVTVTFDVWAEFGQGLWSMLFAFHLETLLSLIMARISFSQRKIEYILLIRLWLVAGTPFSNQLIQNGVEVYFSLFSKLAWMSLQQLIHDFAFLHHFAV